MKTFTFIIIVALLSINLNSQVQDEEEKYYNYMSWKSSYENAEKDMARYQRQQNIFYLLGVVSIGTFVGLQMPEFAIGSFIGAFIGVFSSSSKKNRYAHIYANLRREGQTKDYFNNPPTRNFANQQQIQTTPTSTQSTTDELSLQDRLLRLRKLKEEGVITEEEYLNRRKEIIEKF